MQALKNGILILVVLTCVILIFSPENDIYSISNFKTSMVQLFDLKDSESGTVSIKPVAKIKAGNRWIVVTSVSSPTEDVKRLASFSDWNLVVVADTKTPSNWTLEGVHFLSVEFQTLLPFHTPSLLPFRSYTRKNLGYLYAISQGAEWIYDTDDDNKPYGLGLEQFDYSDDVTGVRYQVRNSSSVSNKLFNPYRFFGRKEMWPRGFPLEYLKEHTNGDDRMVSCEKMKRAAVQQGLVHHDPDVDAIYRLQHADPEAGLNERFNKFAPPIILSPGTYSPWNSQNTLFHKSAFHTLFLPTTVSFRTTDIWRSYFAQKILHLSGFTVSFTPVNAVQYRNAHDYLKDFKDERQVYDDAGKIVNIINSWNCSNSSRIVDCMMELAGIFVDEKIWNMEDANLIASFLKDLKTIGYQFPSLVNPEESELKYYPQTNESTRDVNCRRINLNFELDYPEEKNKPALKRAEKKIEYFGDIDNWCNKSGYRNLSLSLPSPSQLAESHSKNDVLSANLETVLIITNNFEWKMGIGFLQRMYQPYFGMLIFCGSYYPDIYNKTESDFSPIMNDSFNFIHINPAEMARGYRGYHCMTLVKELKLSNVKGYFMISDDMQFNIWQRVDLDRVFHLHGVGYLTSGIWWDLNGGINSAKAIVNYVNETKDEKVLATWKVFEDGLRKYGYIQANQTAASDMLLGRSRSVSDFFYVPSTGISYYADLMRIFYKFEFFHELAVNKFLRSVNHQTSMLMESSYLWGRARYNWATTYNSDYVGMHPIKLSQFGTPKYRNIYCATVVQSWSNVLFGGFANYTMKNTTDKDWMNGR